MSLLQTVSTSQNRSPVLTKVESCYSAFEQNAKSQPEARKGWFLQCAVARRTEATADSWRATGV
jgi:hypothetical protein